MSTILVNTLTGTSTAGSIAVTGEGNSTTTNLQQGLIKAWNNTSTDGTTIQDSFNIASLTDSNIGRQNHNVSNLFASQYHVPTFSVDNNTNQQWTSNMTTGGWKTSNYTGSAYVDVIIRTGSSGDLA